jgi:asparagine synthase (glutamine-hydrolysing)
MCGIAGFYLLDTAAELPVLRGMCDRIRHRGPDDEGFHLDGGCGIGMRRLSIIDLNTGHQPISNEDRSAWVVFNGEIYNYQELRQDLIAQGHHFRTNSDTETLIHLYEQEGVDGIQRLRGMFASAIWDARRRELLLVRDRLGKKPLYYAALKQGIYFASELKCFQNLNIPFELDMDALRLYFQFGYLPEPATPFKAVRKLPPGGWMIFDSDGNIRKDRYWRLPVPAETAPPNLSYGEACSKLRDLFDESVRIRMVADVPLGAFLSGGIDSSSVVASMALQSPEPIKTFSIGFEEASFNELPFARMVADRYRTDHHEIVVRPDSIALVSTLVKHLDEPFADSSAIPTHIVSEFTARHVKVALTGDGGDELFAGYRSFFDIARLESLNRVPGVLRWALRKTADALPYSAFGKNYLRMITEPTPLDRYFESNYVPFYLRKALLTPEWMLPAEAGFLQKALSDFLAPGSTTLTQALYFEATAKLTGDMLVKVDRMSMASSLEVRCPLLDHKLAEFAAILAPKWKMNDRGVGKAILIDALGDRLPPSLLSRPKMGFGVPIGIWFRGPLRTFLRDHLTSSQFLNRGIVNPEFLEQLIVEHESGRRNNDIRLWTLLMLELWLREWESDIHRPGGVPVPVPSEKAVDSCII